MQTPIAKDTDINPTIPNPVLPEETAPVSDFQAETGISVNSIPQSQLVPPELNGLQPTKAVEQPVDSFGISPNVTITQPNLYTDDSGEPRNPYAISEDDKLASAGIVLDAASKAEQAKQQMLTPSPETLNQANIIRQKEENTKALERQIASDQAFQAVSAKQSTEKQKEMDEIQKQIAKENEELKNLSMNDIFKDEKAPINKIQAIMAIMVGALGQGIAKTDKNAGLEAVNKTIDTYYDNKKTNLKERLAGKQRIFDLLKLQLTKQENQTQNDLMKAKIRQINASIDAQKDKILTSRIMLEQKQNLIKKAQSGKLSQFEQDALEASLTPQEAYRKIRLEDGRLVLADNRTAADELRKYQSEVVPAIEGAKRIRQIASEGSKYDLETRAKVATELQALAGQLRLPFTGPGVLTDTEYTRLVDTIGNPNKLFSPDFIQKAKINQVLNKLESDLNLRYKLAGINVPIEGEQLRQKQIETIMKKGNVNRDAAERILEKATQK